jgi:FKBP-type peptidyl-prolyl cis-trans isomerase
MTTETRFRRARAGAVGLAMSVVGMVACGDSTGPEVDWEVIEEATFAPSLGINLDSMNVTGTGVYWKDEVLGSGPAAVFGSTPTLTFVNWLTDGTQIDSGQLTFFMGNNRVMSGLEDGIVNQKSGGTRLLIVPPNRGYGGNAQTDSLGNVVIPGGSVLVFRIVMDTVQ